VTGRQQDSGAVRHAFAEPAFEIFESRIEGLCSGANSGLYRARSPDPEILFGGTGFSLANVLTGEPGMFRLAAARAPAAVIVYRHDWTQRWCFRK